MVSRLFKYFKKIIVLLMLTTFLVQSAMATVMLGDMPMSQPFTMPISTDCHGMSHETNIDLVNDLADCCQLDCNCAVAHCGAALLFDNNYTSDIASFLFIDLATITSLPAPYLPTPYRPPIAR